MSSISSEQKKSFLNHVSGLRGVAILLVVLFHICKLHCPHGYMGVEVFFVISGYFFLQSLQRTSDFRFWPFLSKKLRRILIPLGVLTTCVIPVCILLYPYDDLELASSTALSALGGVSNLYLAICSGGYFDNASANNPLLHTWYVSVLLQLFILCGLGVYVYRKLPETVGKALVWGIGILSFLWANTAFFNYLCTQCGLPVHLDALIPNYYNPLTRLWEFLAGGCIILLPTVKGKGLRSLLALFGCLLVLIPSLCTLSDAQYFAFLPIFGTMLLIRYIPDTPLQSLWECKAVTWVGTISFSLYLTHLPLIVFYKWLFDFSSRRSAMLLLLLATLPPAILYYYLVEKRKFRHILSLLWVLFPLFLCGGIMLTNGLKNIVHAQANNLEMPVYKDFHPYTSQDLLHDYPSEQLKMWEGFLRFSNCGIKPRDYPAALLHIGNRNQKPTFLLLGDSHAHYLSMGFHSVLRDTDKAGVFCTTVFIPFMNRYIYQDDIYCSTKDKTEALFSWLHAHPEIDTVFIGQRWNIRFDNHNDDFTSTWDNKPLPKNDVRKHNTECLASFCERLQAIGKQVVFLTTAPSVASAKPLRQIRKNIILGRPANSSNIISTTKQYEQENGNDLKSLQELEDRGLCRVLHQETPLLRTGCMKSYYNGQILHWDWDHLTSAGSILTVQNMKDEILALLNHQPRINANTTHGNHEN